MSEQKPELDPVASMIQFYDALARSWAKAMSDVVSSQELADTMARQLQSHLEAAAPVRKQVTELMEQYLQHMSLPTHQEVIGLAERLTNLEMRLDDLEAKVDQVLDILRRAV